MVTHIKWIIHLFKEGYWGDLLLWGIFYTIVGFIVGFSVSGVLAFM